jgi:ssDNA-binding Zn-finger/Zn-ribbon topoisomerase 1
MECPPIRVGEDNERGGMSPDVTTDEAIRKLDCPRCGSRLQMTEVYFQKRHRNLLFCTNFGSCNFSEL